MNLMEIVTGAVAGYALYEALRLRAERFRLERRRAFLEGVVPSTYSATHYMAPSEVNTRPLTIGEEVRRDLDQCGGCGAYLPPEEIMKCPGKNCFRFIQGIAQPQIIG